MKYAVLITLAAIAMVSLTAWTALRRRSHAFTATLTGDVTAQISGDASFSRIRGGIGAPAVFTLNLGENNSRGAVLFTRMSGEPLGRGTHVISDRWDDTDDFRALVLLGPASHPSGVFRAQSGTLTITSASENELAGSFSLEASGFTAADPEHDGRALSASGSFTATGN
jgi:hypothetical protein